MTAVTQFEPTRHDAIIFDCDGTVADTMGAHFVAWTSVARRYGLHFPHGRFLSLAGVPARDIVIELLAEIDAPGVSAETVCAEREDLFLEHLEQVAPITPVVELARRWHGRVPMAVASGGIRPAVHRILEHLKLSHLFDPILCAEDTARPKPAPDLFLLAAQRMGVAPGRCVVLEDADKGLQAAAAAGMDAIDVRPWYVPHHP